MPNVTWTKTTAGPLVDTTGAAVGNGDGAGTLTITTVSSNGILVSANNTLRIEEGVTLLFTHANNHFSVTKTGATAGILVVVGTEAEPVIVKSGFAVPTPNDYARCAQIGTNVGGAARPSITADWMIIEHAGIGILGPQAQACDVTMRNCTFRRIARNHVSGTCNPGGGAPWTFTECVFDKCPDDAQNDVDNAAALIHLNAAGTDQLDLDHCTISHRVNNLLTNVHMFHAQIAGTPNINARNCILSGTNLDAVRILDLGFGVAGGTTGDWNWLNVDANGIYTPGANDVVMDPLFFNNTCFANQDLRPSSSTSAMTADEFGGRIGALDVYSALPPDPVGTTGVWAGRKQRVYEVSFGSDLTKARAIRIGLHSTDLKGQKHLAGALLRVSQERLK